MFKEKVNARTDGRTDGRPDGRTHDGQQTMTWSTASGAKKWVFPFKVILVEINLLTGQCRSKIMWLIDWMVFYAAFNSISVISQRQFTLFMSFLGFTSTMLRLWSVLPKDTPTKNPEDLVRLEPRTPWLRVKHFTTEPRGSLARSVQSDLDLHGLPNGFLLSIPA